jgi:hypothetical protein
MKVAMPAARSRSVPVAGSSHPKSDTAHRVHRASEAQRVAEAAPIVFAVLVRSRTEAAGMRSEAHHASAAAIAQSE